MTATTGSAGRVALTFDDGPDPIYTPMVLDVLARRGVRATFFAVGEAAARHPRLVRRIRDEGHTIGSHTRSHPDMWTLSPLDVRRQYLEGRAMVEEAAEMEVLLVRPPKGWLDVRSGWTLRSAGMRPVLWNACTDDWEPGATVASILEAVDPIPADAIVLLHDGIQRPEAPAALDRSATVAALDGLVDRVWAANAALVAL